MPNLTIAVDEDTLRRARARAALAGTSINAVLRNTLEDFAAGDLDSSVGDAARSLAAELFPDRRPQRDRGWTRDDLYDRHG